MSELCRRVQVGKDIFLTVEQHPNTDFPECYPGQIIDMGGFLGFVNSHSARYYHPTPEARERLAKKIRSSSGWCYLDQVRDNRQRS